MIMSRTWILHADERVMASILRTFPSSSMSRCCHGSPLTTWCRALYSKKASKAASPGPIETARKKIITDRNPNLEFARPPLRSHPRTGVSISALLGDEMKKSVIPRIESKTVLDSSTDLYVEKENEYFHEVLEKLNGYRNRLVYAAEEPGIISSTQSMDDINSIISSSDPQSTDIHHLVTILTRISELPVHTRYSLRTDLDFRSLCNRILSKIETLSDEDFFQLLKVLSKFGFRRAVASNERPFRFAVFNVVDSECIRRANNWELDQLFLAADFCFAMRTNMFSYTSSASILVSLFRKLEHRLKSLSREELVLMMYYCNLFRQIPTNSALPLFEKCLEHIDALSLGEIAIVCLGCFKTNTPIHNPQLVVKITKRLVDLMRYADPLVLSAIFKTLYKSTTKSTTKHVPELQGLIGPLLERSTLVLSELPFSTSIHLFRFFLNIHYISHAFLEEICQAVMREDLQQWRMKEIARFLFHLGSFQCYCDNKSLEAVVDRFLTELDSPQRRQELLNFPESLLQGLLGLAFLNIYHDGLIDYLYSDKCQKQLTSSASQQRGLKAADFSRDLFQLDQSLEIDHPEYQGNRLSKELTDKKRLLNIRALIQNLPAGLICSSIYDSTKMTCRFIRAFPGFNRQSRSVRDAIMMEVETELAQLLAGSDSFKIQHLLPHYQTADIEMRLDCAGQPIRVKDWGVSKPGNDWIGCQHEDQAHEQTHLNQLLLDLSNMSNKVTPDGSRRLAVLLFGPNCYHIYRDKCGENSKQLLGLHVMKMRHLSKVGYTIIQIPYFEFNGAQDKQKYLRRKLFQETDKSFIKQFS